MADEARSQRIFYVYVIFRPTGIPCYVGKGKGSRWRCRRREHNPHLQRIIAKANGAVPIVKVREQLTNDEACETEIALIAAIGRGQHGPLINLTDGGDGTVGYKRTAAQLKHFETYWQSPEGQKRKQRQAEIARIQGFHPDNLERLIARNKATKPGFGRKMSGTTRAALSAAVSVSNAKRETTAQTRALRSARAVALWENPETRAQILRARAANVDDIRTKARASAGRRQRRANGQFG